ncbi:hypothetical protein PsalN5692_04006 (plasmid) [Piscirickettsia salmonis]|uniref:hypothetical protein n=1 Tax=Piscirickettsia salmonis TaxID=1238 RepID=UPI003EB6B507|nr:hypothetical protein PsalN5692_04006 [Piscirickettsia salmonis]
MHLNSMSGSFQKVKPFRSKALREASRGRPCVRCGNDDGTTVYAHYTGLRQQAFGKGRGVKCGDLYGADLCMRCHSYFDQYQGCNGSYETKTALSEDFMFCILKTHERNEREGVIRVCKKQ